MRSLIRFGSLTPSDRIFPRGVPFVEINPIGAIEVSRNKLLMKRAFADYDVPQSEWWETKDELFEDKDFGKMQIVAKRVYGYKGIGMVKLDSLEQLEEFCKNTNLTGYYFEKFYNYAREYRFHATQDHVFLRWRKLRTSEATERWFFNNSNCNWIGENNELFTLPEALRSEIDMQCINAMRAVGLDIGAIDIRVSRSNEFIVLEVNSAPRMGNISNSLYAEELNTLIMSKIKEKTHADKK